MWVAFWNEHGGGILPASLSQYFIRETGNLDRVEYSVILLMALCTVLDRARCGPACCVLQGVTRGSEPDLAQNAVTAAAAEKWATAQNADLFVYASSQAVYVPGGADHLETSPTRICGYGGSKCVAEDVLLQISQTPTVILRLANVVGADSLSAIFDKNMHEITLDRHRNGIGPIRSFVSPLGLSKMLEQLIEAVLNGQTVPQIMNFGSNGQVAMEDLVKAASKNLKWRPACDASQQRIVMNMDLAESTLGRLPKAQASRLWSETELILQ